MNNFEDRGNLGVKQDGSLNVHVVVDRKSVPYFVYLIQNFKHTAKRPERLRFHCYALDKISHKRFSIDDEVEVCTYVPRRPDARAVIRAMGAKRRLKNFLKGQPILGGSGGHSLGLNAANWAMRKLNGHHVIADSDVALLTHDWDEKLIELFETYHVIGTTYEPEGGFSSGSGLVQTYKNFPNANWVALRSDMSLDEFNWMPRKNENLQIDTVERSTTFGLPLGYEMVCDVGWYFPEYCAKRGYSALSMEHVKPSSGKTQILMTNNDYNEEYWLFGRAFVGHQRGGSRHVFKQDPMSVAFYACVEEAVGVPPERLL